MTLEERLKEIEARADAAQTDYASEDFNGCLLISGNLGDHGFEMYKCDRDFIAHARTDVPALLATLRLAIEQRGNILGRELGGYEWESINERYNEELLKAGEE